MIPAGSPMELLDRYIGLWNLIREGGRGGRLSAAWLSGDGMTPRSIFALGNRLAELGR